MAIGIDELDDDVVYNFENEVEPDVTTQPTNEPKEESQNYMSDFLKTRGIDDMNKIMFEDDNGEVSERSWNDLSDEEKFNILNTPLEIPQLQEDSLTEEEISLLSQIRLNNMTPSEFINSIKGEQVVQEPQFKIDDLSDDEVYLLDLESRVGELSDEEAALALSVVKQQGEDLYKKQVEGIRNEYKEREELDARQKEAELQEEQEQLYNLYKEGILSAINNFEGVSNFDFNFDVEDKNMLAEFMLGQDETGRNYLYEALQDPVNLTKAAWFILNGDDALELIAEYYNHKIKLVAQDQYNKGLLDGNKNVNNPPKSVVISKKNNNVNRQYKSINDLDD